MAQPCPSCRSHLAHGHSQPQGKHEQLACLRPAVSEQRWDSLEELQAGIARAGLELQLLQLEGGALASSLLIVSVPPLRLLQLQIDRRLHILGPKPKDVLSVSLDLDPRVGDLSMRCHGHALSGASLFGLDSSQEVHLTLPPQGSLGTVFLPLESLRNCAEELHWPGFDGELDPPSNLLQVKHSCAAGLRRYLRQIFALARRNPRDLQLQAIQRLILDDLIPLLLEALSSSPTPASLPRPPARIDLVKEVQQWMHAHPTTPISLTDLCSQAHASRRTLIQGFQDHLGMPPMTYLKLIRLHGVRRRLLEVDSEDKRIGPLAAEWGFYNAGHFAADYRRLFGERPRETLRRAS